MVLIEGWRILGVAVRENVWEPLKIGPDLRLEEIRLVNFVFLEWYSQRENHSIPSYFFYSIIWLGSQVSQALGEKLSNVMVT